MLFDPRYTGIQDRTAEDRRYAGSTFGELRQAIFANAYYRTWRETGAPPLPVYKVTLRHALMGLLRRGAARFPFQRASDRIIDSRADLRWGADQRGFRRIVHPNGVCLTGFWEIDPQAEPRYTGHFTPGTRALVVARYSVCCTETHRGHYRSLSIVGKIFPTTDPAHPTPLRPASFITQEDLGGALTLDISGAELRNAPDVTPWRRGTVNALAVLLVTGFVLGRTDKEPTIRQLYEIAELGKPPGQATSAPVFMRLIAEPPPAPIAEPHVDFRDEILGRIYDPGDPVPRRTLTFHVEVSDTGTRSGRLVQRQHISNWTRIGRLVFDEAVASYNGDFVIHFPHPRWRNDRNDPATAVRRTR